MSGQREVTGYVDLHCHGGGGFYFSDPNPENIQKAINFHKNNGSADLLASLVSETIPDLKNQILSLIPFCEKGSIAGIHLEGPYLAKARCGAHNPDLLKAPNVEEVKELLEIANGHIKMITIAPELPGAVDAIKYLSENKVIAAIGHSNGSFDDALTAIDAGASLVTHFSNGMSKLKDGEKTFASALLYKSKIPLEIIVDGRHVSRADLETIFEVAPDRIVLVTDAMAASGQPDGNYRIGSLDVIVEDGIARLVSSGALAGSTLTMNLAVENARKFGLSDHAIVNAAATLPKKLLSYAG
jgi:N-acetylglucosamine-6-phosphate deacetylase